MPKDTVNKYGGGGSNILRGGRRSYNCQTLVGNFVEASCQSATNNSLGGFQGGAIYRSTTKEQMQEGIQVESPLFGAALKPPRSLEHPQLLNNNSNVLVPYNNRGENTWESVTHSVHSGTDKATEFSAPKGDEGKQKTPEELEQYRNRWTKETDSMKKQRYVTENTLMFGKHVDPRFTRKLSN